MSLAPDALDEFCRYFQRRDFRTCMVILYDGLATDTLSYFKNKGAVEAAEDLTQRTLERTWQGLPGLRSPHAVLGWYWRIAWSVVGDYRRQGAPLQLIGPGDASDLPGDVDGPSASDPILRHQIEQILPIVDLLVIQARHRGFSNREIADFLMIDVERVKKRFQRAMSSVRSIEQQKNRAVPTAPPDSPRDIPGLPASDGWISAIWPKAPPSLEVAQERFRQLDPVDRIIVLNVASRNNVEGVARFLGMHEEKIETRYKNLLKYLGQHERDR